MVDLRYRPCYVRGYPNVVRYMYDLNEGPSGNTGESLKIPLSHRVVDQLSPHHDSQFSAFSTEVFNQMNRKHNRSSSPGATLANRAERKVAELRSRATQHLTKDMIRS